jgi:type IV secretory pathway VirB10-like protein
MTMNKFITVTMLGMALTLSACAKDDGKKADKKADKQAAKQGDKQVEPQPEQPKEPEAPTLPPLDPKVEQAVTVANLIAASPGNADTILSEAGLDREAFEKLLYEIARDPELSKSYAVAREA